MNDFEEEAISRIYGLERRVSRIEKQVAILFAALMDGNDETTNRLNAILELEADATAQFSGDDMELELFAFNLREVRKASAETTEGLMNRLLLNLENRISSFPKDD